MVQAISALLALSGLITTTMGHGFVTNYAIDGSIKQGFLLDYYYAKVNGQSWPQLAAWYAENLDSGFVQPNDYGTAHINCHKNSIPAPLTNKIAAGGNVKFYWGTASGQAWPHPYGPILTYMAACNGDCSKVDKTKLAWFKIQAAGINYATQVWASQDLINNNNTWTATVPKSIAAGTYVLRHEIIALHGAGSANGAQNYPQCFNVEVTGGGTARPQGVLGSQLYKATDPGILFNPYTTITDYQMPGPALFTG